MTPPTPQYKFLGNTGLRVSSISLGGWITVGENMQLADDKTLEIFQRAYNLGINYFDVAEEYGNGACEKSIGHIIRKLGWQRERFVLSTKLFWGPPRDHPNCLGLSRKHIIEGMNQSLDRLQLDYVDVVFAHRPDPYAPMEEVVRGFTQLINDGKAFYWGTSMWTAYEIEHAHHIATKYNLIAPIAEQPKYNLLARDNVEKELAPIYKEYNYGTTVFSPLETGLLTGKYSDPENIPDDARYSKKNQENVKGIREMFNNIFKNQDIDAAFAKIQKLQGVADKLKVKLAPLALAWCLKNPNVSTVIIGASRPDQIDQNLEAYNVLPLLTDEVLKEIDEVLGNKPAARPDFGRMGQWPL